MPRMSDGEAEQVEATSEAPADETKAEDAGEAKSEAAEAPPLSMKPGGPGISSLKPDRAGMHGGMAITVFGGGFVEGCKAWVDNVATDVTFVDSFSVRFEAPPHPPGRALIEIENPDGQKSNAAVELAYVPGPAISSVTPHFVPPEGGTEITVEGSGFEEGSALSLFGVHAPTFVRASDTVIKFKAPPRGDGPAEGTLVITGPDGISTRYEDALFYRALDPKIERLDPAHAWVSGGKAISVYGKDFHASCVARIGDTLAEVRFQSESHVEVVIPPAEAPGKVTVSIENPDGSIAKADDAFTYERVPAPPKLISITPDKASTAGGTVLRISGDNFTESMRVRIAEVTAVTKFVSAKIVEVEAPPHTLPGAVAVELSESGIVIRSEDALTYFSPKAPKIIGIEPMTGPASGGTKVVIEGDGFPPNASVRFGTESAKHVVVKSTTTIETVAPPSKVASTVDVEVTSAETGPGVKKSAFRYEAVLPPVITSVAPPKGGTGGGTELTVEGKNFAVGATVLFGKKPAKSVKRISGSILEVKSPEGDDGQMVDVVVKNPDGKEAVQKRAFQYDARYRG